MFHPVKAVRKHQKKIMTVVAIGSMITFVAQYRSGGNTDRGLGATHGYIHGKAVSQGEFARAAREWEMLGQTILTEARMPDGSVQLVGLRYAVLKLPIARIVDAHPDMFYLLVREAQDMGVTVSPDVVRSKIANDVVIARAGGQEDFSEREVEAVTDLLMVEAAVDRAGEDIKVSQAMIDQKLAQEYQEVSLKVVEFPSAAYLAQAAPPGGKEVSEQFHKYADVESDASADGWGYKYPNRIKLQYLTLRHDDLRKAVAAQVNDIDVHMYYLQHPEEFAPPTTAPAAPATQPFSAVRERIYLKLLDARATDLGDAVLKDIGTTMSADYAAWARAVYPNGEATTQPADASKAPMTPVGPAYQSLDYLQSLALRVQQRFGILPVLDAVEDWHTRPQLAAMPGIGGSRLVQAQLTFADYASSFVDVFLPEAVRHNRSHNPPPLAVMALSPVLADGDGNRYLFRATAAQAAHAPALQLDVEDQVENDVRLKHAYDLAKAAAERFLDLARQQALVKAAAAEKVRVVDTGLFAQDPEADIPNYPVAPRSKDAFVRGAFLLLNPGPEIVDREHPLGIIELPLSSKVLVVQVDEVRSNWDRGSFPQTQWDARRELEQHIRFGQLYPAWFDYDALVARLQYRPETAATTKPDES